MRCVNDFLPITGLLDSVIHIAQESGSILRDIRLAGRFNTVYKEDDSPLTDADKVSHHLISSRLSQIAPDIPILSEESLLQDFETRKTWDRYWLIDPLDGTKEYVQGIADYAVNIALIVGGIPALGIVHAPEEDVTYFAVRGLGASKITQEGTAQIRVSDYTKGELTVVVSRSHSGENVRKFLEAIGPVKILNLGSVLKMCRVAEGAAHFYPRLGPTMEWDTAAAQCVVTEAGGRVTDIEGRDLVYNKPDLKNPYFVVCGSPPFPWQKYRQYF